MKRLVILAATLALSACGNSVNIVNNFAAAKEKAKTEIGSAAYIEGLAQNAVDGFSQAVSDAVASDEASAAAAYGLLAEDEQVWTLEGETVLESGGSLVFEQAESSLTLKPGGKQLLVNALQRVVKATAGDGLFDVDGEISYAADLTYSTAGLYGEMTLTGTLRLAGDDQATSEWTATVTLSGVEYAVTLNVDGEDASLLEGKAKKLFPIPAIFDVAPLEEKGPTQVCGSVLTTDDYVTSVTAAQSAGDFIDTDDNTATGHAIANATVCFVPAKGGGYDIYAARTNDYPIRPVTGETGPTSPSNPTVHELGNDFVFYGKTQTTAVVNTSGSILFDPNGSASTQAYIWPWFIDDEYGVIGSSWDSRASHATYSFLVKETPNEFVVSASASPIDSTNVGELQIILKLDTNEILLNYGRYDMFGIAPGIYAGSVYSEPGGFKLVEYIPGTGLTYSPY